MRYRKWVIVLGISAFFGALTTNSIVYADDTASKWVVGGQPTVHVQPTTLNTIPVAADDCEDTTVPVVSAQQLEPQPTRLCVSEGKDIDIGYFYNQPTSTVAVRIKTDQSFRPLKLNVLPGGVVRFVGSINTLMTAYSNYTYTYQNGGVAYADLTKQLVPNKRDPKTNAVTEYGVVMKSITLTPSDQFVLPYSFLLNVRVDNGILGLITSDGPYILVDIQRIGFMKIDITTGVATFVASYIDGIENYDFYSDYNPYVGAISADGRYVFVGGTKLFIYDTANCGDSVATAAEVYRNSLLMFGAGKYRMVSACPRVDVTDAVMAEYSDGISPPFYGKFSDDDSELSFVTMTMQDNYKKITINAPDYTPNGTPKLGYLALGDSYSSGEGDVADGSSHYIHDENSCHLSSRSYPFLLREYWGIPSASMQSVACSGAKVLPDYIGNGDYYGQHNQMHGWDASRFADTQAATLENFTPGAMRQIEFVKRYKPERLTFTGGGNDVGFASIIEYCADSYRLFNVIPTNETCAFAADSQMRANLNRSIDDQYDINKLLVEKIREASPATKIYMVGYPQFIAIDGWSCANSSDILNKTERQMIHDSVSRLNNILKKVARDTGVYYVDIEDSLEGGEICQGSDYMTGPLKMIVSNYSVKKDNNMFHPNADGHKKIAEAIEQKLSTGLDYTILDIPDEQNGVRTVKTAVLPDYSGAGSTHTITMDPGMFKPDGEVSIELFSQSINLGTAHTTSDGALRTDITFPKNIEGDHLLTITGLDTNGERVQLQQFITITSGIPNDIDGDGILDKDDACSFITHWYSDGKDICLSKSESYEKSIDNITQIKSGIEQLFSNSQNGDGVMGSPNDQGSQKQSVIPNDMAFSRQKSKPWLILVGVIAIISVVMSATYVIKKRNTNV